MINVVATLKVLPGKEAEFEAAASDLVAKVNANEPDCYLYEICRSKSDLQTYVFMERYKDQAAIDFHGQTDYFLAAQRPLGACLAGRPDIQPYTVIA